MATPPTPSFLGWPLCTLWAVRAFGLNQREEPTGRWWMDNRPREKRGVIIFQYALKGKMLYRDAHGEREVPAGWAALFSFGEESAYGLPAHFTEAFHTQWLSIEGTGLAEHCALIRARFGSVFKIGADNPLLRSMRELTVHARPRSAEAAALHSAEVYSFLMRLYLHLERQWAKEKAPVERAVDELLSHATAAWSLKEVAQRHGCSREHLSRVFRERTGMPPAAYLIRTRLNRALELLRETSLPIAQIARQSGFSSKFALSRWVRHETGAPPGAYRAKAAVR